MDEELKFLIKRTKIAAGRAHASGLVKTAENLEKIVQLLLNSESTIGDFEDEAGKTGASENDMTCRNHYPHLTIC